MFEIIYPENRICVDYGDTRELVLIGILENETRKEKDIYDAEFDYIEEQGLRRATCYDCEDWRDALKIFDGVENVEGVVVHFTKSDFRVKMKIEWYKKLSYLMSYFTKKSVWKLIRDGKNMDEYLEDIADEFYDTLKGYVAELWDEYNAILDGYKAKERMFVKHLSDKWGDEEISRKKLYMELVQFFGTKDDVASVLAIIDEKDMFPYIWKRIEPKGE